MYSKISFLLYYTIYIKIDKAYIDFDKLFLYNNDYPIMFYVF